MNRVLFLGIEFDYLYQNNCPYMLKFKWTFVLILHVFIVFSQVEEEVNPPDFIKTITFKGQTRESALPIVKLNEFS